MDAQARASGAAGRAARRFTPEQLEAQRRARGRYEPAGATAEPWGTMGDFVAFVGFLGGLKRERERLGLSLDDMAARTGIDRTAISKLENGRNANPTVSTLVRYANALGRSLSWGLAGQEAEDPVGAGR